MLLILDQLYCRNCNRGARRHCSISFLSINLLFVQTKIMYKPFNGQFSFQCVHPYTGDQRISMERPYGTRELLRIPAGSSFDWQAAERPRPGIPTTKTPRLRAPAIRTEFQRWWYLLQCHSSWRRRTHDDSAPLMMQIPVNSRPFWQQLISIFGPVCHCHYVSVALKSLSPLYQKLV